MPTRKTFMAFFDNILKTSAQYISCDIMKNLQKNENTDRNERAKFLNRYKLEEVENPTPFPSGKQRQKKSGRGLPTPSLIASVITEVISTENNRPMNQ